MCVCVCSEGKRRGVFETLSRLSLSVSLRAANCLHCGSETLGGERHNNSSTNATVRISMLLVGVGVATDPVERQGRIFFIHFSLLCLQKPLLSLISHAEVNTMNTVKVQPIVSRRKGE